MPASYAWNNSAVPEASMRFSALSEIYDPPTIRHIQALGVRAGWSCLEVGGGGGSIARWLSQKVGDTGRVLVTDIDTRFLDSLHDLSNVEVLKHDITKDELPTSRFDLAHARLVLIHLPEREKALARLVSSLKPGGNILIEDFDIGPVRDALGSDYHPKKGVPPKMSTSVIEKMIRARGEVLTAHGADLTYARRLFHMLRSHGLNDVGMEGFSTTYRGGSKGSVLEKANSLQSRDEILASGMLTDVEFEEALKLMDDPEWVRFAPFMVSVWGRKT
jgi:ubiquinone/menaquinone biosynthesis C-methylase UbiE